MSSDWVDFKDIKTTVSMRSVLDHYGIQLRQVSGTYLRGQCPLPSHSSSARDNSFTVNTAKNIWACQSQSCVAGRGGRKGGNVLDFVRLKEDCSLRDAALKLQNWFSVPSAPKTPADTTERKQPESKLVSKGSGEGSDSESNQPLKFQLRGIDSTHDYVTRRGITKETADHFGVGFFPGKGSMAARVVIPICDRRGELVAYAGRSIDGSEPKYKFPAGFSKSLELWNLHRALSLAPETVIVVEGFFDCMTVHQSGHPCVVALMGSAMSDEQENLVVENFSHAIIMLDGDQAGREATVDIAARLSRRMFVKVIDLPDRVQPDLLSPEDLRSVIGSL